MISLENQEELKLINDFIGNCYQFSDEHHLIVSEGTEEMIEEVLGSSDNISIDLKLMLVKYPNVISYLIKIVKEKYPNNLKDIENLISLV